MKKRSSAAPVAASAALAILGVVAFAVGCNTQQRAASDGINNTPPQVSSPIPPEDDTQGSIVPDVPPQRTSDTPMKTAKLMRVVSDENGSRLEQVVTELPQDGKTEPAVAALNLMAQLKSSPLPSGTRARSVEIGGDGVAAVDFNEAFVKNFTGGDEDEALALNAVTATLGQFPGVSSVQFLVEGKKIAQLGGTQDLTEPLRVPQKVSVNEGGASSASSTESGEGAEKP